MAHGALECTRNGDATEKVGCTSVAGQGTCCKSGQESASPPRFPCSAFKMRNVDVVFLVSLHSSTLSSLSFCHRLSVPLGEMLGCLHWGNGEAALFCKEHIWVCVW